MRQEKIEKTSGVKEKPIFFTNVEVEQTLQEKTVEDGSLKKDTIDNRETRSVQSLRRPNNNEMFTGRKFEKSQANLAKKGKHPPWMKKKRGPKFLLDFRRAKPEMTEENIGSDKIEKPKLMYLNHPLPNRETYFIPKLKPPRNPQLAKIQAYFVSDSYTV